MKNILIIEDDPETQFLFSEILENEGHKVAAVSSGKEALAILMPTQLPDIIFMDLTFPDGTPEDFVSNLRTLPGGELVSLILVSGKYDIADYAKKLQAKSFLKKPFEIETLLTIVG